MLEYIRRMPTRRFLALDGLRGVCALIVLFYHCSDVFHEGPIFLHGFLAVDMFFILSGFVISLTYEERLKHRGSAREFLANRARRLFPTYWLGAIINIALFIGMASAGFIASEDSWWMIWLFIPITTLLLIPDLITPDGMLYPAMDSVAWSLLVEWVAYFGYGFGTFRWKTWVFAIVAIAGWATMLVVGFHSGLGWHGGADRHTFLTLGLLRCLPSFAAGVVIYRVHRHPLFTRLPVISTEILFVLWMAAVVLPRPMDATTPILDAAIGAMFAPLLVCLLVRSEHKAPAYCARIGELSYPLYVVHSGLIVMATYTPAFGLSHGPRPLNATILVLCCLALSIGVAAAIRRVAPGLRRTQAVFAASVPATENT